MLHDTPFWPQGLLAIVAGIFGCESKNDNTHLLSNVFQEHAISFPLNEPHKKMSSSEAPEIHGLLYKKRGGFGKMMMSPWVHRLATINHEGLFSYYDTDNSVSVDRSR